jgi:hypothetical protein
LELGVIRSGGENQENRNEEKVIRGDVLCRDEVYRSWDEERIGMCEMMYVPFSK